jgi:hypothetical protein
MRAGPRWRSGVVGRPQHEVQRFGLGRRGTWALLLAGVTLVGILEAVALSLLGGAVLPDPVATVLDAVVALGTLTVLTALASPLWSSHRLDDERVRLRLGWLGDVVVPLVRIGSVTRYTAPVLQPAQLGTDFDPATGRLSLVRSGASALVLLELNGDVAARYQGLRHVHARAVLISVDDAARFVAAVDAARA